MTKLDGRLNAHRPDLADIRLRGRVEATDYAEGRPARVSAPVLDLRNAPRADAGVDTQLLCGDDVLVFEEREGWAWLQSETDGYVGYASSDALARQEGAPTHVVVAPRTFVYPGPELKSPAMRTHSMGARLRVVETAENRGTAYALLENGEAVIASHLRTVEKTAGDYVTIAEELERTPYLWGGASAFGIDCSGLVQLAMRMAGRSVLRDTDMQAGSIGGTLDIGDDLAGLRRGDLVFWKGHVAVMLDGENIIHANGHTMMVSRERLRDAVDRIAYLYGRPTVFRRP
ncbi:NlpC/P60 family protein [Aquamicrobium sp. LC103]|uniref:C40 family peptidase n=1 Tax=Aquamicrobium sp. LC103 TaxID=1120658 RepID=UPI00063E7F4F|nr:NlpC/P60 family protein [Aquamicrobium sp. LC103]TKT74965.1 NlpC/P60 family protein [Aquamicrobium sp. LC103]